MSLSSKSKSRSCPSQTLLGIEAGGTHTSVLITNLEGEFIARHSLGPGNFRLLSERGLKDLLIACRRLAPSPVAIGIGMAGIREEEDCSIVQKAAQSIWPKASLWVDHDLHSALKVAQYHHPEAPGHVMVVSGTGSCCFGQSNRGKIVKCGGWGQHLGDRGSAYDVAYRAIREVIEVFDHRGRWPALGTKLLRATAHVEPNDWIAWFQEAEKSEIAALAVTVLSAWKSNDPLARKVIHQAVDALVSDAVACIQRLQLKKPHCAVSGSMFAKNPAFTRRFTDCLGKMVAGAEVRLLKKDSAWGTIYAASSLLGGCKPASGNPGGITLPKPTHELRIRPQTLGLSTTESRLEASMNLDQMSPSRAFDLFQSEDASIHEAIQREKTNILKCIRKVAASFKAGGRLLYVGAGTSGRLGVLDASECPPTFGVSPDRVVGVIAGGRRALWHAVEGAEDDSMAGWRAMQFHKVKKTDTVVGIAASGKTPFVLGALSRAAFVQAGHVMLCFNPSLKWTRDHRPEIVICPATGPEILTGSTRLKAGTATKLILNMMTTLAMVELGKVRSNLMIDVQATNEKLKDRAVRMVCTLTGVQETVAKDILERCKWSIQETCRRLKAEPSSKRRVNQIVR